MPYKFRFYEDGRNEPLFQCSLQKRQCIYVNPNTGHQCRRQLCKGIDLCWYHLLHTKHLRIKKSTIPGAGMGLFAALPNDDSRAIVFRGASQNSSGQNICRYNGEQISKEESSRRYGIYTGPYLAEINSQKNEDAACVRGIGSYCNEAPTSAKWNANLYVHAGKIFVRARKNIRNGDEIFVNYGDSYNMDESTHYSTR